jgi:hypothetical protein
VALYEGAVVAEPAEGASPKTAIPRQPTRMKATATALEARRWIMKYLPVGSPNTVNN